MTGTGNHQRALAIVAGILWLLGVVVLPALHEGRHANDHTHAADGTIVRHGDHQHVITAKRERTNHRQLAVDHPVDPGHQAGGVAHHAVALQQALPPALPEPPRATDRETVAIVVAQITAVGVPAAARGPPAHES